MRFYGLLQATWGILQNLGGLMWFLRYLGRPHSRYHGAVVTRVHRRHFRGGWTLGAFIFLTDNLSPRAEHDILIHEYGHTVQSIILGPAWPFVIGLPSMLWCNLPPLKRLRRKRHIAYEDLYCEGWATRLGAKVLREEPYGNEIG